MAALPRALLRPGRKLIAERRGSMSIFGLFIFLIILMVGGLAVDMIRYENRRVHLQNTADRAALAAGSLRQPNDPKAVVREYFEREGLSDYLVDVFVDEGLNFRRVHITTEAAVPSLFLKMVGVNALVAAPVSAAEERYSKVEVSLVLDLSNSMNSFNRIENLRDAGADFIDTLFENSEPDQISVSVVPYTGQVNAGAALLANYNYTPTSPYSHCVEFDEAHFEAMTLSTEDELRGAGHFDPWFVGALTMAFCPTHPNGTGEIVPLSGNPEFLRTRMTNLVADGNTSIEIGMKWAAVLLAPETRPVIENLVDDGVVAAAFADRPLDYDDPDVLKVIVLMTDGENFEQWQLHDDMKVGMSNVWRDPATGRLSAWHEGPGAFYLPHNNSWANRPAGAPSNNNWGAVYQMANAELFMRQSVRFVAWNLNAIPLGTTSAQRNAIYWDLVDTWLSRLPANQKNARLSTMCSTIRDEGIAIFTVAFEAPPGGVVAMQDCATSPSHFFDVEGADISDAFRAIAGTINRLRLTQ